MVLYAQKGMMFGDPKTETSQSLSRPQEEYNGRKHPAHAELLVIREACRIMGNERLSDCDLYVTLEPCAMCAALIAASRIRRLYYGASDKKSGGVENGACIFSHSQTHHRPEIYPGICEDEVAKLMTSFFGGLRRYNN